MEPQLLQFLNRIIRTLGLVVLWMLVNSTIGLMWGYAYVGNRWQLGNMVYYIFLLLSLIGLLYILYKIWRHPIGIKID